MQKPRTSMPSMTLFMKWQKTKPATVAASKVFTTAISANNHPFKTIQERTESQDSALCSFSSPLSSDGNALRRLADEGQHDDWAESSVRWAKKTFGEENVVGAHLHMDEQTPHLHVTVVPIVTTERKKKATEAKARKR
ncbi:MAG TPA: hypothetical protein DEG90_00535, partial [Porphyromonadaceae bacterium]|nr:hypothetical protein [Porphyromonadaceae bacterium]